MGNFDEALSLCKEILGQCKLVLGDSHPLTLIAQNNLGSVYEDMGNYDLALPLYLRTLEQREQVLGGTHPHTLASRDNLAGLYKSMGSYDKALLLGKTALTQYEKVFGKIHPDTMISRDNLADRYRSMKNYKQALPLYKTTLEQRIRVLGDTHPDTLRSKNNLAGLYGQEKALPLYITTLRQSEAVLGETHPDTLATRHNLAILYGNLGSYQQAFQLLKTTLAQRQEVLGKFHPETLKSLNSLAFTFTQAGEHKEALVYFAKSLRQTNRYLEALSWGFSDLTRHQILDHVSWFRSVYLSVLMDYGGERTGREVMHLALKRDGMLRRIATIANQLTTASDDPALKNLVTRYRAKQALFASLSLHVPKSTQQLANYKQKVIEVEEELDKLGSQLAVSVGTLRPDYLEPEAEILSDSLDPTAILVCFVVFPKLEIQNSEIEYKGRHLVCVIATNEAGSFPVFEMGPLAPIAESIEAWRLAVTNRWHEDVIETAGRALYTKVWQPLAPYLEGKETIYVVAGGPLQLIPLGALPAPDGQPLDQVIDLVFMDAVHDILPISGQVSRAKGSPLFCYAPDFGERPDLTPRPTLPAGGSARSGLSFTPLPGAKAEGEQIISLFKKAGYQPRYLTAETATETALAETLDASTPSLLHLASHGFLLESLPSPDHKTKAEALLKGDLRTHGTIADLNPYTIQELDEDNPLLRSGIAMAGANLNEESDSGDDGLLTALEAESLNLTGTRLVVLSACETGLGEQREGEGVYGLRRAFFLAGTRALLTTLWPVDDIVTRRFMERFYQLYLDGSSPRQALRQVQREFQASEHDSHPVFWAPFHLIEIPEIP